MATELPELAIQTAARWLYGDDNNPYGMSDCLGLAEGVLQALADDGWQIVRVVDPYRLTVTTHDSAGSCRAVLPGDGYLPTYTCHLPHGHDGPFHRDRDGSRWEDNDR